MTGIIAFGAVVAAVLAGLIGHGILRPFLEARGVTPWSLKDTLGSTPLVLIGSALIGGATGAGAGLASAPCLTPVWAVGLVVLTISVGFVTVRLGLIALQKMV